MEVDDADKSNSSAPFSDSPKPTAPQTSHPSSDKNLNRAVSSNLVRSDFYPFFSLCMSITPSDQMTEFLLYTTPNGDINVEVFLHQENLWLTQDRMAELFGVQRPAITKHLANIFADGELHEHSVSSILEHTANDGKKYQTKFYNLDAIIAV